MISVLIATKNRPSDIEKCLQSIENSKFTNYEILLTDQSNNYLTKKVVKKLGNKKIKYFKHKGSGKAKALNSMFKKAKGQVIAFTDDDCIVASDWLQKIELFHKKNQSICGVFGRTLPYMMDIKNKKNLNKICMATCSDLQKKIHNSPYTQHYKTIGLGNNMSFKKKYLIKTGYFKEWLGVGTFAKAAEESDLIFRLLKNNNKLYSDPSIVVRHNRWLNEYGDIRQQGLYTRGLMAFYFYYLLKNEKEIKSLIIDRIKDRIIKPTSVYLKNLTINRQLFGKTIKLVYQYIFELINVIIGITIAIKNLAN